MAGPLLNQRQLVLLVEVLLHGLFLSDGVAIDSLALGGELRLEWFFVADRVVIVVL